MIKEEKDNRLSLIELPPLPSARSSIRLLGITNSGYTWATDSPRFVMIRAGMSSRNSNRGGEMDPEYMFYIPLPTILYGMNEQNILTDVFAYKPRLGECYPLPLPSINYSFSSTNKVQKDGNYPLRCFIRPLCINGALPDRNQSTDKLIQIGTRIDEFWNSTFRYYTFNVNDSRVANAFKWSLKEIPSSTGLFLIDPRPHMKRWESLGLSTIKNIPWDSGAINNIDLLLDGSK